MHRKPTLEIYILLIYIDIYIIESINVSHEIVVPYTNYKLASHFSFESRGRFFPRLPWAGEGVLLSPLGCDDSSAPSRDGPFWIVLLFLACLAASPSSCTTIGGRLVAVVADAADASDLMGGFDDVWLVEDMVEVLLTKGGAAGAAIAWVSSGAGWRVSHWKSSILSVGGRVGSDSMLITGGGTVDAANAGAIGGAANAVSSSPLAPASLSRESSSSVSHIPV